MPDGGEEVNVDPVSPRFSNSPCRRLSPPPGFRQVAGEAGRLAGGAKILMTYLVSSGGQTPAAQRSSITSITEVPSLPGFSL